jgi:hypothetical protein
VPWLFGFADGGIAQWLPQVLGALTLGMSLVTDYEPSLAKLVPHMEMQSAFAGNTANSCAFICAATCGSSKGDHHGRQQER